MLLTVTVTMEVDYSPPIPPTTSYPGEPDGCSVDCDLDRVLLAAARKEYMRACEEAREP